LPRGTQITNQAFVKFDVGPFNPAPKEGPWINTIGSVNTQISVTKCTVTAGSKDNSDKISFSGKMYATADDFNDANAVEVAIDSNDMVSPCIQTFPINGKTFKIKNGTYSYSGTENKLRKSFAYNVKTGKFSFTANNVELSGLGCPLSVGIEIGDYIGAAEVNETIVNGLRMPIPIQLMRGVKDVLRVERPYDKYQVKYGNEPNTDQLLVKGGFAVEDTNMSMANRVKESLVVTLGTQTFTIPANKAGKGKFTCSKADVNEGGTAAADFNFNTCSFTLTIKKTNITAGSGDVDFCVAFAGYSQCEQITLP
jgi:hypothetical protein